VVTVPSALQMERELLLAGDILALSESTARELTNIVPAIKIKGLLPVPIETDLFKNLSQAPIEKRLGFFGRYDDPRKNVELFLATLAILRERDARWHGYLAGGAVRPALQQLIAAHGLRDAVTCVGRVERSDLPILVSSFDVFFLSSHQEGLCISALEAMACGVPVVSTRCGGPEEFVIDGQTGKLVSDDPQEAADAIEAVRATEQTRRDIGERARELVHTRYSIPAATETLRRALLATFPDLAAVAATQLKH
jgi:glycosyltransferase involved in cell wall biosynthesis